MSTVAPVKPVKSNEWYTPSKYIEAAREVMGGSIDLDPASCALANETVKAARYFTKDDDGLSQAWYGNVWLNPPYCKVGNKSQIALFVEKLITEYKAGNVSEAILLATVRTDAAWFRSLWQFPICFTSHHIHFYKLSDDNVLYKDSRGGHFFGTSFTYLGPNEAKFIEVFSQFGTVARRVTPQS